MLSECGDNIILNSHVRYAIDLTSNWVSLFFNSIFFAFSSLSLLFKSRLVCFNFSNIDWSSARFILIMTISCVNSLSSRDNWNETEDQKKKKKKKKEKKKEWKKERKNERKKEVSWNTNIRIKQKKLMNERKRSGVDVENEKQQCSSNIQKSLGRGKNLQKQMN